MTLVTIDLTEPTFGGWGSVASGIIEVTYWTGGKPYVAVEGDEVRFSGPVKVLTSGTPVAIELPPTTTSMCARWVIKEAELDETLQWELREGRKLTRYTQIPDVPEVSFGDLIDVDPATYLPSDEARAAWEASVAQVQALVDEAHGSEVAAGEARDEALLARDAAQGFAGSAESARSGAEAALGTAEDARQAAVSAQMAAEGARDAASGSALAADGSADAAHGDALAAAQSRLEAAGFATSASESRNASAASATDAGLAKTAAETARTEAEAARDLALAGQFAGSVIPLDVDLDTYTTPGVYKRGSTPASPSLHVPVGGGGILLVFRHAVGYVQQEFTSHSAVYNRGKYIRSQTVTTWTPWRFIPSQRVDTTAGLAVYTWDDVSGREQMIYGDTGWRNFTALIAAGALHPDNTGQLFVRRIGNTVTWRFSNLLLAAGSGSLVLFSSATSIIPLGFRCDGFSAMPAYRNNSAALLQEMTAFSTTLSWYSERSLPSGNTTNVRPPIGISGQASYLTSDPWPTTLPGTPA